MERKFIKACESPEYVYLARCLRRCWDILPLHSCFWIHCIFLPLDESTVSGKVLSEKQATVEEHKTPVPVPLDHDLPVNEVPEFLSDVLSVRNLHYGQMPMFTTINESAAYALWN